MIHIDILGCGEAFDPDRANSSVLVTADGFRLLIDCGMGVAQAVWQRSMDADFIDAVYFTHLHVDHCGGLPALLDHMGAAGRKKPLVIYGPDDALDRIEAAILFAAWPGKTLDFPVQVLPKLAQSAIGPMTARFAQTEHSATNHAIRLELGQASFFYSGDGRPTPASRELMTGVKVAFHETQALSGKAPVPGHCDFDTVQGLLDQQSIGQMWLYHTAGRSDEAFAERLREAEDNRLNYAKAGVSFAVT
ncbi:MBL fold metallo-hydrolase [Lacibacterium aquatile]|uniref:MBL fold metallo-hydrolase n=1 Tax=Lacibacterium aquatile TaxID=1168082 RepID=A0ABW5DQ42_9PROT